jgi:hypothetical protein
VQVAAGDDVFVFADFFNVFAGDYTLDVQFVEEN